MATHGLGDAARLFASTRHAGDLKARLAQLSQELSTGHAADPVAATGGDTRGLRDLERGLATVGHRQHEAHQPGQRQQGEDPRPDELKHVCESRYRRPGSGR